MQAYAYTDLVQASFTPWGKKMAMAIALYIACHMVHHSYRSCALQGKMYLAFCWLGCDVVQVSLGYRSHGMQNLIGNRQPTAPTLCIKHCPHRHCNIDLHVSLIVHMHSWQCLQILWDIQCCYMRHFVCNWDVCYMVTQQHTVACCRTQCSSCKLVRCLKHHMVHKGSCSGIG